jgi:PD-(D/E)XK endonuclease
MDGERLLSVECKWARRHGDVIVVRLRTSRYTPKNGYVRTDYTADEVDAVGVYCPDLDRCYLIPIADVAHRSGVHLRRGPARNNQATGLKWAQQYEFGAIAQLGERCHGMAEVGGSSPPGSTEEQVAPPGGLFAL